MNYKNIVRTVYKVSDFLSWHRNGSLILSPSFQRRSVWNKAAKSYLIDTIIRGLPIPIIFLREKADLHTLEPIREVVDGQQRLRTIISYVEPYTLKNFNPSKDEFEVLKSHNSEIGGKKFSDLDQKLKRQILNYEFSVHVLPSDTEDREILQIFARMNSTGVKLNRQELRNAQFFGVFKRLAYNLSYEQLNRWRKWSIFSETDVARMIEVEETSDLILTIINGLKSKSQTALDKAYRDNELDFPFEDEVTRRFRIVMDKIDESLGSILKNTVYSRKILFNTLFTYFYDILFGLKSPLIKQKPNPLPKYILSVITSASERIEKKAIHDNLLKVMRGATGNLESRKLRLEFLKEVENSVKT